MQENGALQPEIYRHTRTFLKVRSTPTEGEVRAQMKEWQPETENAKFHVPAVLNRNRNLTVENSQDGSSSGGVHQHLPTLIRSSKFPKFFSSELREEDGQLAESLCTSDTTWTMH